ncbi:MAG TPA: ROK family protein [Steroidobacteraceae bacterium]|nr:ROK family protein [Steroidobacteraceae bacterium]
MGGGAFGVDVGGSSIKYAVVDTGSGRLLTSLAGIPTPQPGDATQLVAAIAGLARRAAPGMPVGVALPCVIRRGVVFTAANLHASLIGTNIQSQLREAVGQGVACLNDADAAGLAEVRWGAARGIRGTVMVLTFGTGIGSALFVDGRLVPNTELGHMEVGGVEGEQRAAARVRTEQGLDWAQWCERVNVYLDAIDRLFWPEMIVIGGGISKDFAEYGSLLHSRATLVPARLGPAAGVVGAAMAVAGSSP